MDKNLSKKEVQMLLNEAPKGLDKEAIVNSLVSRGYILEGLNDKPKTPEKTVLQKIGGVAEKVADFTGGKELAQGVGQALAMGGTEKRIEETQKQQFDLQGQLLAKIKENKQLGKDTSRLETALADLTEDIQATGEGAEAQFNPNELTGKQIAGDVLQLGTTLASVGSFGGVGAQAKAGVDAAKAGKGVKDVLSSVRAAETVASKIPSSIKGATGATGILSGAGKGFVQGVKTGTAFGASTGVSQGLQDDKTAGEIVESGIGGAVTGGIVGGVLGSLVGGVTGGISGRKLNQEIIAKQEESGIRPTLTKVIKEKAATNPKFQAMIKEAQKQGFDEKEINLIASMGDSDIPTIKKMYEVTAKAQSDPRQIVRAADILGENATGIVTQVQKQNSAAGKLVDVAAKSLKGKSFDATPIRESVLANLDDAGISIADDGAIDFSQSVFKNTPKLQKEIARVIKTIPDGSDAYQAHIFKKSVDELVDYGSGGEGLSGKASSMLKGFRTSVDDVLDANFSEYNLANTEYKVTREFIDAVKDTVGKNVDFSTKQGAQAFGQAFRSAFSNNKSRGQTLALIEQLQDIAKKRGLKGAEQNLLDQALYVNLLEDTFGSQAATGLASEVAKGVGTARRGMSLLRDPISGTLDLAADVAEKAQNITPEAKKQLLQNFLSK